MQAALAGILLDVLFLDDGPAHVLQLLPAESLVPHILARLLRAVAAEFVLRIRSA